MRNPFVNYQKIVADEPESDIDTFLEPSDLLNVLPMELAMIVSVLVCTERPDWHNFSIDVTIGLERHIIKNAKL